MRQRQPPRPDAPELRRTCTVLGIPYGRGKGIVFHDTRHSAVTNLVGAGVPEVVALTVTGHADRAVFQRYNVRRDDVQADALERQEMYLTQRRGTTPTMVAPLRRPGQIRGTTDHATRNPINSTTAKALSRQRLTAMTSRTRKWRNWQTRRIQDPVG